MAGLDFLKKGSATERALRSHGAKGAGDQTKSDVSAVLTAALGSVVEDLFERFGIRLAPEDQKKIRTILASNLDPASAHTQMEKERREQRLNELNEALDARLGALVDRLAPQAPTGGVDVAAILAAQQASNLQMMQNMMAMMTAALAGRAPAPIATPAGVDAPIPVAPAPEDVVIELDTV
jgi:hypothetical protein